MFSPFRDKDGRPKALPDVTWDDLAQLKEMDEGFVLEFKCSNTPSVRRKIPKIVASFANSRGGWLVVGIADETKELTPIPRPQADFSQTVGELCRRHVSPAPPFDVRFLVDPANDRQGVGLVQVAEGDFPPYVADGVVEILNTKDTEFNLFDEKFLKEVAEMKEKNLALELLKRLLEQHIRKHAKKNMTQADKFSEMLDARLAEYLRGLISNEEVIQELLKMAHELKAHAEQASELGLTEEEQAFYDAITRPQAVRDFYENETLVTMAKELTEALRNSKTIDWRQKESARANMRRMVKRLLKKYKYPPEEQEKALETVIKQCELYADSDEFDSPVQSFVQYEIDNTDYSLAAEP